jgi:serine/threonine-protein kinase
MPSPIEPPPDATRLAPGTLVAERYRIESVLGEGGMGVVYLAEHIHIRKRHALKVLLPKLTNTPEIVARFEREAIAAGAVSHPNVAAATDFGRLDDGSCFLVLEYVPGRTLRAALTEGPLPPARALAIAREIALGVSAAHAKGIVHRDLKPENVMLVTQEDDRVSVKVLDFGLARLDGLGGPGAPLTSAGTIVGSPHYMAPEQVSGAGLDARADLYALGVLLFEMLTGERPLRGDAMTVMRLHLQPSPPPLAADALERIPPHVQPVVTRLLQRDPSARYASAGEVIAAVDACLAAPTAPAAQAARLSTLERATTRIWTAAATKGRAARAVALMRERPRMLLAAGAGVVVLGVLAVVVNRSNAPAAPPAATDDAELAPPPPTVIELDDPTPAPPSGAIVTCLDGRFGDHVANGQPSGDARGILAARKAVYWIELANRGRATHVTLVWRIDGREVQRQTLDVGRGPRWRTWGARRIEGAREIEVQVLDAAGHPLKVDSLALEG